MGKKMEIPVSEMDDQMLQIHAMGVAYREAERRREETEKRAEEETKKLRQEIRDLETQLKEMTVAYQALMTRNNELGASLRKQEKELESLRKAREEKQTTGAAEERGQDK